MQFVNSFSTFNPISGYFVAPYSELSKSRIGDPNRPKMEVPLILDWIAGRAQKIVQKRRIEEIENALNAINYLLYLAANKNVKSAPPSNSNDPIERAVHATLKWDAISIDFYTPARLLNSQVSEFNIDGYVEFPNAEWRELFAVLALAALGDIHRFYPLDGGAISVGTVGLVAEAMEALAFAEVPSLLHPAMDERRKKRSLQGRANAIKGHAALNERKAAFCEWVLKEHVPRLPPGQRLNKRKAAREYCQTFLDAELRAGRADELKGKEDRVRILAEALATDPRFRDL